MGIERWELDVFDRLSESPDGAWDRYEDHAAEVERLQAILRTLLGLHDAEVFVKEPWDTTFEEARATLREA